MEDQLGFRCRVQQPGMAVVTRDAIELMFTHCAHQTCIDHSSCRIVVDSIDALHAEYAQRLTIHPRGRLRDTPYGTREFGIIEPHGALMTFIQVLPIV